MKYYEVAILRSNQHYLIYKSAQKCNIFEIVEVTVRNKKYRAIIIKEVNTPKFKTKILSKTTLTFSCDQIVLANFISQYYICPLGESFGYFVPKDLSKKSNLIGSSKDGEISCSPLNLKPNNFAEKISENDKLKDIFPNLKELNNSQKDALKFLKTQQISLLFGDTGSGKTEIYMHLISETLRSGKNILFLMPEISLTPQITQRLKLAFGSENIEIWHSKINLKKRKQVQEKLDKNEVKILAGARSAFFANLQNLGLIIVDEEHDSSYKSNGALSKKACFNVRDLCVFLGQKSSVQVVLGSGTPSVTSYFLAKKHGYLYRLRGQFHDTKRDFLYSLPSDFLSLKSLELLNEALLSKKQTIIFVPTRANFRALVCKNCFAPIMCKNCSSPLSVHHKKSSLICHYCGFKEDIPLFCPTCFHNEFFGKKSGTVQIEKNLKEHFPNAKISIFDTDHAPSKREIEKVLKDFENKKIDILIGTQMISKGHDYDVSLVIVLGIDLELKRPIFSSLERTFGMLYQVSGRSARMNDGQIMIESANKEFISQFMNNYESFLTFDIESKKDFYPPFCKLILLRFIEKSEDLAKQNLQKALQFLYQNGVESYEIIGSGQDPVEKINNKFYYHIFLRTKNQVKMLKLIRKLKILLPSLLIDVDPMDFGI